MHGHSIIKAVAIAGTVALATTACLSTNAKSADSGGAATAKKTVEIMFGFGNDQTQGFKDSLDPWAKSQGITIKYTQSAAFETQIATRVAGGDLPDIAAFPQPGILKGMASKNKLQDLDTVLDMTKLKASLLPGFLSAGTVNNKVYGVPIGMNVKSLYWYDKANFAKAGYTVPKTQADLLTLMAKIKADGKAPLCVGIESGSASGWPATDWIEDYVLQVASPADYDAWVAGTLKFSDPKIKAAFDIYNELVLTQGNVYGGRKSIASTAFGTALNPLFKPTPGCYLGKQGNFITQKGFFPDDVFKNLDSRVGVFVTPPVKAGSQPVLGGGDLAAMFTANDANVTKVMKYISEDPTFGGPWAKTGGFLSPHKDFDSSKYPNKTLRDIAAIAAKATVFRFDGSDQMPGKVGSGSFWKGMVAWTADQQDEATTVKNIDSSWPSS
ncbi:MAG: ABC transporter substrate-binding protein [Dermatophilaceae bacterium]